MRSIFENEHYDITMSDKPNIFNEFLIRFDCFMDDCVEFWLTKEEVEVMIKRFKDVIK